MKLKELAQLLNLSQTTISRALNGYPEVSEATRQRVLRAAKATGYSPNIAAQRLATGRAGSIGLVLPVSAGRDTDLHFAEYLSGLGEVATASGVQFVVCPSRPEDEAETFSQLAASGSVDALSISYIRTDDPRLAVVKRLNVPYVVHGRHIGDAPDYPFLDTDNEGAFHDATRLLVQLGHRRIAILNGPEHLSFAYRRRIGMTEALAEAGLALESGLRQNSAMTEENGFRGMMGFLDAAVPPTAVLCSSVILALGATRAIRERGLTIGDDVSIIAFDDVFPYLKPENFSTPLTTTTSSIRSAGARIAERLIAAAAGREVSPQQEIWKTSLIVRASTGPVRRRARRSRRATPQAG